MPHAVLRGWHRGWFAQRSHHQTTAQVQSPAFFFLHRKKKNNSFKRQGIEKRSPSQLRTLALGKAAPRVGAGPPGGPQEGETTAVLLSTGPGHA